MAVDRGSEYTVDELYDNYEFKVVKRAIMREFPWIKNVTVDQDNLDRYSSVFLDFEIDLPQLLQTYNWPAYVGAQRAWDKGNYFHALYLTLFADTLYEESKAVSNQIESLYQSIHKSPALPSDLRLKEGRRFAVGDFFFNKGNPEW